MRRALVILALASLACACKGRSPNYVRKDLPFAGEAYGPEEPSGGGGHAIAFEGTHVHIAEARGSAVVLETFREDGVASEPVTLLEVGEDGWEIPEGEMEDELVECLAAGPRKVDRSLALLPGGLGRVGDGWVLAYTTVTRLACEGGRKVVHATDSLATFDGGWKPTGSFPVRHGDVPRVHAVVALEDGPALAWATRSGIGVSSAGSTSLVPTHEGALEIEPILVRTDGLAVITRTDAEIRVRLYPDPMGKPSVDAKIGPGSRPTSVAAAWTGDRLGVFFAVDSTEGVSTLLQHVLVEIFPDATVSAPVKVYTQYSIAEDAAFTRHLAACFSHGRYALAWVADDGYSQDIYLQEVGPGGETGGKLAWRVDLGDGFRGCGCLSIFPTPPQYVIHWMTATSHPASRHNLRLTALPLDR